MKWGILILVVLGIIAAACAALLVGAMGAGSAATANNSKGIEVIVAKRSLPAMTIVTLDDFVKQSVPRNEMPQGQVPSPTLVVGRALAVPVVGGQVLTESCFIPDGAGARVVGMMPDGMRYVTLNLNSRAVPDALFLYPGSVVDVLFSFKLSSKSIGEAGALTILSGIQVVAVNGESIVSDSEQDANAKTRKANAGLQVTVMVDQKQAEALQVLADNGNLSLTIRNPLDKTVGDKQATVLSQGQLARLSELLTAEGVAAPQKERAMREWLASQVLGTEEEPNQSDSAKPGQSIEKNSDINIAPPVLPTYLEQQNQPKKNSRWGITVIRGVKTETEEIPLTGSETETN